MKNNKKIVVVIPARGSSKGIVKKNIKLVNGKPLIWYAINVAKQSEYVDEIIVSSDDDTILNYSELQYVKIDKRKKELSGDKVTLDPVIFDLIKRKYSDYDYVVTIQPTSALIKKETLDKAIETIISSNKKSLISLKDATHLYWKEEKGQIVPDYSERLNRQELNKKFVETGSLMISEISNLIKKKERLDASSVIPLIIPEEESIDIDSYFDLLLAESILKKKKIAIVVIGNKEKGSGHVRRQLTLAWGLGSKPVFYIKNTEDVAKDLVKLEHYPIKIYKNEEELLEFLKEDKVNIVINDILNTTKEYVNKLKKEGFKVINFEDFGEGANFADFSINSLYEFSHHVDDKKKYGYKYVCLRFDVIMCPKKKVNKEVKKILITCGGTDPNNLTEKYVEALSEINFKGKIDIVLGQGYSHKKELKNYLKNKNINFKIYENISSMAKKILNADIVLTSNGRTIYEVVNIGVPCISICQNQRELMHNFGSFSGTINNLGLFEKTNTNKISREIKNLIKDYKKRKEINKKMLSYKLDKGLENILNILDNLKNE